MGKKKEHQNRILKLAGEIISLGESIRQMEENMESTWTDEVERKDLQNLKEKMEDVERSLCNLQEEIGHLEELHCKQA